VSDVLAAACESVNAAPDAVSWLARAAAEAEAGTASLGRDAAAPPGIVKALVFSSVAPRQRGAGDEQQRPD
jgi:hypothetical protein